MYAMCQCLPLLSVLGSCFYMLRYSTMFACMFVCLGTWLMTFCCMFNWCCIWYAFLAKFPNMLHALHVCMVKITLCMFANLHTCPHVHVAYLASMPRLHCIEHACFASWIEYDKGWALCVYLVCTSFEIKMHNLISWAIMHRNARLVVQESSTIPLWVINMIRGVLVHTFAWNA